MKGNVFHGVIAAAAAGAAAYFQELALPVVVLFLVMVMDYISGMVRAWTRGELCSRVGIMGIVKKAAYLLAVVVAIVTDWVVQTAAGQLGVDFGGFFFFGLLVTAWLVLNECISILENISQLGVPLPSLLAALLQKPFPVFSDEAGIRMRQAIEAARMDCDSVGGVIRCFAVGLPAGVGEPMFAGVENRLAGALFGIPAVRGVSFGTGFAAAGMRGSQHNDPLVMEGGRVATRTNHAGGAVGGITNGMPLVVNVAVKPTASIAKEQDTVDLETGEPAKLVIPGRHDPCIVPRAVPVVEAAAAIAVLDAWMETKSLEGFL